MTEESSQTFKNGTEQSCKNGSADSSVTSSRRNLLKSFATLGVAATVFPGDIVRAKSTEPVKYISHYGHSNHEEVKRGAPPKKKPKYSMMSRKEWVKMRAAEKAKNEIFKTIRNSFKSNSLKNISITTKQ